MNESLYEIPARTLARKLGICYQNIYRDVVAGIIPARRFGRLWMVPLNDARVKRLFQDKNNYRKERKKFLKRATRPVVYLGNVYETQAELARAVGVSKTTVRYWIDSGKAKFAEVNDEEQDTE